MFIVIVSQSVPDHLRGYLTRFLAEIDSGVYVGRINRRVSDGLWERIVGSVQEGSCVLVRSSNEYEQGFEVLSHGTLARRMRDLEGLWLSEREPLGAAEDAFQLWDAAAEKQTAGLSSDSVEIQPLPE